MNEGRAWSRSRGGQVDWMIPGRAMDGHTSSVSRCQRRRRVSCALFCVILTSLQLLTPVALSAPPPVLGKYGVLRFSVLRCSAAYNTRHVRTRLTISTSSRTVVAVCADWHRHLIGYASFHVRRFGNRSFNVADPRLWNSVSSSLWQDVSYE